MMNFSMKGLKLMLFQVFYLNLVSRGEVRTLFETFCKTELGKKLLTVKEFLDFINNHQRDPRKDGASVLDQRISQ
jgi:hypothetical protein